jgi:hypothetical protein
MRLVKDKTKSLLQLSPNDHHFVVDQRSLRFGIACGNDGDSTN